MNAVLHKVPPPLSYLPKKGMALPVRPSIKCDQTPWNGRPFQETHDLEHAAPRLVPRDEARSCR